MALLPSNAISAPCSSPRSPLQFKVVRQALANHIIPASNHNLTAASTDGATYAIMVEGEGRPVGIFYAVNMIRLCAHDDR